MELTAYDGCTNYTHLYSSGHMHWYMRKLQCLYWYSQQGWENKNLVTKSFWFRQTQHQGLCGHGKAKQYTFLVLGKWQCQCLLWKSGLAHKFFQYLDEGKKLDDAIMAVVAEYNLDL
jgi:hypothetical protein